MPAIEIIKDHSLKIDARRTRNFAKGLRIEVDDATWKQLKAASAAKLADAPAEADAPDDDTAKKAAADDKAAKKAAAAAAKK